MFSDETLIAISDRHQMSLDNSRNFLRLLSVSWVTSAPWVISGSGTSWWSRSLSARILFIWVYVWRHIHHPCRDHYSVIITLISDYQLHFLLVLIKWHLYLVLVMLYSSYWMWGTQVYVAALVNWWLNCFLFCWNRWIIDIVFLGRLWWNPFQWSIKSLIAI